MLPHLVHAALQVPHHRSIDLEGVQSPYLLNPLLF